MPPPPHTKSFREGAGISRDAIGMQSRREGRLASVICVMHDMFVAFLGVRNRSAATEKSVARHFSRVTDCEQMSLEILLWVCHF